MGLLVWAAVQNPGGRRSAGKELRLGILSLRFLQATCMETVSPWSFRFFLFEDEEW